MAVKAITPDYKGEALDSVDKFHGNIMFHVNWEKHLMFCAPLAFAMPPEAPFSTLIEETLPGAYGYHPDNAEWLTEDRVERTVSPSSAVTREEKTSELFNQGDRASLRAALHLSRRENLP